MFYTWELHVDIAKDILEHGEEVNICLIRLAYNIETTLN